MKHIKTTSSEESKAKKDYATIEPGDPVVADEKMEETANQLLKVLREIDDKKLEASKLTGVLMGCLKHKESMKSKDGKLLCTWLAGNISKSVDYEAILKHYNVKIEPEVLEKFTKTSQGSRRFSLELE